VRLGLQLAPGRAEVGLSMAELAGTLKGYPESIAYQALGRFFSGQPVTAA